MGYCDDVTLYSLATKFEKGYTKMFEQTREIRKQARLLKNGNSAQSERKLEKTIRIELQECLEKHLENNDCVEVEIDAQYVGIFLKICESLTDYSYVQVDQTLFRFEAKEFTW